MKKWALVFTLSALSVCAILSGFKNIEQSARIGLLEQRVNALEKKVEEKNDDDRQTGEGD